MAVSMPSKQKVYHGVLTEIRHFINSNNLQPGDKLPSERELAEKLQAGRSSIREALRAMELLGLIETRHGEGTYLSAYRSYQTVELLSSFILQGDQIKVELLLTIRILEKEAAKLAFDRIHETEIKALKTIITSDERKPNDRHAAFFSYIFERTDNLLFTKVWRLMYEFAITVEDVYTSSIFYQELIQLYVERDFNSIETLFDALADK
ncbi:GntR family transcriptional regulator [Virgibacillus sp. AGTR]|uniref:FadR/GntR family transcriptional regulator n=1 Tax=Virgibacillus TaxID=84406 RepID=UPI0004115317|nr:MULTISPECIES: GntR family transcriptional regulator [Bacillaceae]MCC2250189.1 GntR family transcriptional regulator [Virgibacillus sp. AGTR]WBX78923.1 GntR family transcriptional regulator [Virgibacillus salarius]